MSGRVTLTTSWDDGHPLDQRLAERLVEHGLTGTFYIPRRSQLEVMNEPQIAQLAQNFEIGGHTMDHLPLTSLTLQSAERQVIDCMRWVADVTGRRCEVFCPPLGKFAAAHREQIAAAGFLGYRTVELLQVRGPKIIRSDGVSPSVVEMPTTVQSHPHQRLSYIKNAAKRRNLVELSKAVIRPGISPWEHLAISKLAKASRQGGVFHLWGHSWEIEDNHQWEPLERVLTEMARLVRNGQAICQTNGEICRSLFSAMS